METERLADRVGGFERELVDERFRRKTDAVLALQQWPECATNRRVFAPCQHNARILQRLQQLMRAQREAAVADAQTHRRPKPLGADVVAIKIRFAPRRRIHYVAVPLHQ